VQRAQLIDRHLSHYAETAAGICEICVVLLQSEASNRNHFSLKNDERVI
jgi:hypothetical protein